jgi:DNA primase
MTIDDADVRGFYEHLGIHIPQWASDEAAVSCFANRDAHRNGDRHASCSINLIHGAWNCHGCGAKGSAYDAAIALGYSSRSAFDLKIRHRLPDRSDQRSATHTTVSRAEIHRAEGPRFAVTNSDIRRYQDALTGQTELIIRLTRERGWRYDTMLELELGYDCSRITIPVRDEHRQLVGLMRYRPWPKNGEPKMLAAPGSRRQMLPHPSIETSQQILLVEGEPDMIAARSRQLPAIAIPGVDTWRPAWARLLAGREITIVMDCDPQGRAAGARIAQNLSGYADPLAFALDIAPGRNNGYDLTDLFRDHPRVAARTHR